MENVNTKINVHYEKDKNIVSFLMVCEDIDYLGTERNGDIVFFKFSPSELVNKAIKQYFERSAQPVQPKDLLDAIQVFRREITE